MSKLTLIIKREFIAKVRNKSFIVMTFLSPLLFVAIAAFVAYLGSMKADVKQIAIHDETGIFAREFKSTEEYNYHDVSKTNMKALRDSVGTKYYEGLLFIPDEKDPKTLENKVQYISNDSPSLSFIGSLEEVIADKLTKTNLEIAKLDTVAFQKAKANVDISLSKSSGEQSIKGFNELKIGIGCAFGYLIMMFIIIYGNMVMRSVIEEKTNRIIEIIISSVKPFQLMMGKIIGTSLAGVLQFLIWAIIGFALMFAGTMLFGAHPSANASPEMMQAAQSKMGNLPVLLNQLRDLPYILLPVCFVIYFVGGYFLYSSFYAAIGAAVDNETDSQQFLLPIIMPLILAVYIGIFTVINDPHGTVATVFSMVPLTSPIVMLMRIPFGVPWWQLVLSILILFGTFLLVVWFASKIYRVGILMYGKKPTWKELIKWMRY